MSERKKKQTVYETQGSTTPAASVLRSALCSRAALPGENGTVRRIVPPEWLSAAARKVYARLGNDLLETIPDDLDPVDAQAIAMAAYFLAEVEEWVKIAQKPDLSLTAKLSIAKIIRENSQEARNWLAEILATPASRQRTNR